MIERSETARLSSFTGISEKEVEGLSGDIEKIRDFISVIEEFDIDDEPPPLPFEKVVGLDKLRDDRAEKWDIDPSKNAPLMKKGHFFVPKE